MSFQSIAWQLMSEEDYGTYLEEKMSQQPNVDVWDNGGETADRYTVIIGDDVFAMSDNATAPNGVNMYITTLSIIPSIRERELDYLLSGTEQCYPHELPDAVNNAINQRIIQLEDA
jgi:hypothetical protein